MLSPPPGLGPIHGAAMDTQHPDTVYVTDGQHVARSRSGGCSWTTVLDLVGRAAGDPLATGDVTSLVVPAGRPGRVYATVSKTTPVPGTETEPVLVSFDYGRSWQNARGVPPLLPSRLRASPANPDAMYLSMHTGQPGPATVSLNSIHPGDLWAFYASADGGRSWARRSIGQIRERFVPDPTSSSVVWSLGSETSAFAGPYRSSDGGATWKATAAQPANNVDDADIDVFRSGNRPARVVVAQGGASQGTQPAVYFSPDAGATFRALPPSGLNGLVRSIAFGRSERDIVLTTGVGVYRFLAPARQWADVDNLNLSPLMDATHVPARVPVWWFWRPELMAVYIEALPPKPMLPRNPIVPQPPLACPEAQTFLPGRSPLAPRATLDALGAPLALDPSVPSHADFRLSLPAVPSPLDTYFLLDTSTSMGSAIDGVICGLEKLVNSLSRAGVDGQFGLGEFQDAAGLRYRRDVDIGPPGVDLQSALRSRTLSGGDEPHRGALYQTATGAGLRDLTGRQLIAPRQQADYRADALRVVLMITDEPYQNTTSYEPTVLQVVNALRARHIHHIGIHVRSEDPDPAVATSNDVQTRRQLEEFSRGTDTFAPKGGVDCDGDGRADVPAGAPLVCTVGRNGIEANLAQTLTNVLLAVRRDGVATLRPVRTDGMQFVLPAGRRVDVRADHTGHNALLFSAGIRCSEYQAGIRHTLVMAADVSGKEVARTPFPVTCGPLRQLPGIFRPPGLVAAAPPAAAVAPVPATNPTLSGSFSAGHAVNPASAPGAVHGEVSAPAAAIAPEDREPATQAASNVMRMLGAGMLFAGFGVLEMRRRSARRAVSKVRR